MLNANEVREAFKDFFRQKGHKIVPSAPMIIKDDPTLMFTNAGMNQFKDIITGGRPITDPRVADSQKCLRVSGKHNDLEEVGHDTYHHTMFEMLGNWSFGDYFKKEAISWAWEFLTEVLKLDRNRLYATVFEGSKEDSVPRDDEAAEIWLKYLPADHIINGNKHDNFWEMGDTGPCGPCSEIHIDLRSDEERANVSGNNLVNKDHPQVIEIWNLVFMQYDRKSDGSLHPLPNKVIDTGMGFERLCMALQGKRSNYDTDVFLPIISEISRLTSLKYGDDKDVDVAMRVVADHLRTISFSIADGQLPSNAKAGYVIRRILRRAVRYAYNFLDQKDPFIYRLVDVLVTNMGDAYPEISVQKDLIKKVIKEEELAFLHTLATGMKLLESIMNDAKQKGSARISGKDAFTLYDTYGFPLDLTELILREQGMTVDGDEFKKEMDAQKQRARNAATIEAGDWIEVHDGDQEFVGYDFTEIETEILRYRKVSKKNKTYYQVILAKTPFYGEMGGQTGDKGQLSDADGNKYEVFDTIRETGITLHLLNNLPENIEQKFVAEIDRNNRVMSSANHSATHLLHEALREVLGDHVEQKGSYVSANTLRFDFSHFQKVTPEELRKIEHIVNSRIRKAMPLEEHREIPIAKAKEMGAMALFGEKYGDKVRTVRFGSSIELCGGTHVNNTGEIGMLRILSESSVAAGIRRIEALTGSALEQFLDNTYDLVKEMSSILGNSSDIKAAIRKIIEENNSLHSQVEDFMAKRKDDLVKRIIESSREVNGIRILIFNGQIMPDMIKNVAFGIKHSLQDSYIFVATTVHEEKPLITLLISDDLVKIGYNAGKIVREAARHIKGGGGGQPFFAQAGGKDADGLGASCEEILKQFELE